MKELLKQLIIQNKNQQDLQHEILQMKSTLKDVASNVLEMQITSIQDIQRNMVVLKNDYQERFSNISISSSISDPKKLVNRFCEIRASYNRNRCES